MKGMESAGAVSIVDDDEAVSDSLSVLLRAHGLNVRAYPSGTDFLMAPARRQTKFLIIDQHMPGMAGLDVVAALRREGNGLPAVLMTGKPDPFITKRAGDLGVLSVLEKPVAAGPLVGLIRQRLAQDC